MIGTMAFVLAGFGFLIRRSYRRARIPGEDYRPEGKLRWTDEP
jgi:hypothetical protein